MGATSRANSVRFDETANTNHFSHSSRASGDLMLRTSSALGGLQLGERSMSYKSEGRASSQHSLRSAASGRANSLNMDLAYGESIRSPLDTPGFAPGLALLGAVPAIIRCWMNTNFKHDALLYAAVCSGSFKSFLHIRLIHKLGFESLIRTDGLGVRTVELPIFFPEAVPLTSSSRSSSPAPNLPSLNAEFRVIDHALDEDELHEIQVFIGSDVLRAHNADILFSSNSMTIYDGDRNKLSIPLARPENQRSYTTLYVTSGLTRSSSPASKQQEELTPIQPYLNGLGQASSSDLQPSSHNAQATKYRPSGVLAVGGGLASNVQQAPTTTTTSSIEHEGGTRPASRQSLVSRPSLGNLSVGRIDTSAETEPLSSIGLASTSQQPTSSTIRSGGSSPAIWANNWRRGGETNDGASSSTQPPAQSTGTTLPSSNSNALDWGAIANNRLGRDPSNTSSSVRREGGISSGIKVLKPKTALSTTSTRAVSASMAAPSPVLSASTSTITPETKPSSGSSSRFFEEGRQRTDPKRDATPGLGLSTLSTAPVPAAPSGVTTTPKTKTNPIGGASAFSWLNPAGGGMK
jgi:hypothetical protein